MIGGLSWQSTVEYYRAINLGVQRRLGGRHAARILLSSVNFAEIERLQVEGRWDLLAQRMVEAGRTLEGGGAEFVMICANTMHKVAPELERAIAVPLLHIVDATAEAIRAEGLSKVGLLATRFTMNETFYVDRLREKSGIEALVPEPGDREEIHRIIHDEIMSNALLPASREKLLRMIDRLVARGAQGVILGCTEIPLLVSSADSSVPLFDTALIHSVKAVDWALGG
jgi:aspartate racemase